MTKTSKEKPQSKHVEKDNKKVVKDYKLPKITQSLVIHGSIKMS